MGDLKFRSWHNPHASTSAAWCKFGVSKQDTDWTRVLQSSLSLEDNPSYTSYAMADDLTVLLVETHAALQEALTVLRESMQVKLAFLASACTSASELNSRFPKAR